MRITVEDLLTEVARQAKNGVINMGSPQRKRRIKKVVPITPSPSAPEATARKKGANQGRSKKPAVTRDRSPKRSQKSNPQKRSPAVTGRTVQLLAMLKQRGGASLKSIMKATGWQAHSVRGFISGVLRKKLKLTVVSKKRDGERYYSL